MAGSDPDPDEWMQNDKQMVSDAVQNYRSEGRAWSVGGLVEGVLWSFAVITVVAMLAAMPWVGADNAIPGTAWIALSCGGLTLFGGAAFATRWIRSNVNTGEVDRHVDQSLSER
jgi:hypothetical protein